MSLENHPNFHAVGFASDVTSAYFKRLRVPLCSLSVQTQQRMITNICLFIEQMEYNIDQAMETKKDE